MDLACDRRGWTCILGLAVAAVAVLLIAPAARGEKIVHSFKGVVDSSSDPTVADGSVFSGTIEYDSELPALYPELGEVPSGAGVASYGYNDAESPGPADALRVRIDLPGLPRFDPSSFDLRGLQVMNDVSVPFNWTGPIEALDELRLFLDGGPTGPGVFIYMSDPTGSAIEGLAPPAALDLADFSTASVVLVLAAGRGDQPVFGTLTELHPVPVPEPGPGALLGLVATAGLARRLVRSRRG